MSTIEKIIDDMKDEIELLLQARRRPTSGNPSAAQLEDILRQLDSENGRISLRLVLTEEVLKLLDRGRNALDTEFLIDPD